MKRWVCSLFLLASCADDVSLNGFCPSDCYAVEGATDYVPPGWPNYDIQATKNVGQCRSGVPTCDENFSIIECVGEVLPDYIEYCDGIDNNCNGHIDDAIQSKRHFGWWEEQYGPFPCEQLGICRDIIAHCEGGGWVCDYPNTYEQGDETRCDGLDNDCDGRVDEDVFSGEFCYSGPIGTEFYFPCHPGVIACIDAEPVCLNEQLPVEEACNRVDDDCDGVIDNTGDTIDTKYDIVFIIDRSGSMCSEIDEVAIALDAYIAQFAGSDNYRFAIVDMTFSWFDFVEVIIDFTDLATVQAKLLALTCSGPGAEASLDAMFEVCSHKNSVELNLSWRDDASAAMFVFTDERDQTLTTPPTDKLMVTNACLANVVVPFVWGPAPHFDFVEDVGGPGGARFDLVADWQIILENLNSVLIMLCGGGQ